MSYSKDIKESGGQGGKLGHSNMTHWTGTEEIKIASKKKKRLNSKKLIKEALEERENNE